MEVLTKELMQRIVEEAMKLVDKAAKQVVNGHLYGESIAAAIVAAALKETGGNVSDVLLKDE